MKQYSDYVDIAYNVLAFIPFNFTSDENKSERLKEHTAMSAAATEARRLKNAAIEEANIAKEKATADAVIEAARIKKRAERKEKEAEAAKKANETNAAQAVEIKKNIALKFVEILNTTGSKTVNKEENIKEILNKINCIECSIKKLELDMRLANEDSFANAEFEALLNEIKNLCNNNKPECQQNITYDEFQRNASLKRKMNSFSGMIKIASFICPILAFANKNLLIQATSAGVTVTPINIVSASKSCSAIISYIMSMINVGNIASIEAGEFLETGSAVIDFVDKTHDVGVIEAVFTSIHGYHVKDDDIQTAVKEVFYDIVDSVETTANNNGVKVTSIKKFFEVATLPQRIIGIASLSLLIMYLLLNSMLTNTNTLQLNTNNIFMPEIGDQDQLETTGTLTTGGKRNRQNKQQSHKESKSIKLTKPTKTPKEPKPTKQPKDPKPTKTKEPKPTKTKEPKPTKTPKTPKPTVEAPKKKQRDKKNK